MLGASDLEFSWILVMIHYLFIVYFVILCLSIYCTLGSQIPWVMSNWMRMEGIMGQMCDETVVLGSTGQKVVVAKMENGV